MQSTVDDPDVTGQTLLLVLELVVDDVLPHCKLHSVHSDQFDHAKTKIEKCQKGENQSILKVALGHNERRNKFN